VIDDNRLIANSLTQMVEVLGHTARPAYGSMAGMQLLSRFQPDVILMDIHMQGLNGIDFCRMIRQNAPSERPVIIVISTDNQPEMIENARAAGASGFLSKPISIDELEPVLRQVEAMLA
jgi:CheY-like chemotaxis protein